MREVLLEDALDRDRLRSLVHGSGLLRWAVIGGSHSGMLAVMNLAEELATATMHHTNIGSKPIVVSAYKSGLVFAEPRLDADPIWNKHDGIGLKGPVAQWSKRHFGTEDDTVATQAFRVRALDMDGVGDCEVLRVDVNRASLLETLESQGVEAVVNATGFDHAATLPTVTFDGQTIDLVAAHRATGDGLWEQCTTGNLAHGLYGAGIAFPQFWTDPEGDVEPRVGFGQNFSEYIAQLIPGA